VVPTAVANIKQRYDVFCFEIKIQFRENHPVNLRKRGDEATGGWRKLHNEELYN
jgi:hypothetical protein